MPILIKTSELRRNELYVYIYVTFVRFVRIRNIVNVFTCEFIL